MVLVTPQNATLGMKKVEQNEKVDSVPAAVPADVESGADLHSSTSQPEQIDKIKEAHRESV